MGPVGWGLPGDCGLTPYPAPRQGQHPTAPADRVPKVWGGMRGRGSRWKGLGESVGWPIQSPMPLEGCSPPPQPPSPAVG